MRFKVSLEIAIEHVFRKLVSFSGMPSHASVATAKSAIEGLTKSVAADLAPKIRVNAIAPTITDTELASKLLRNLPQIGQLLG